MSGKEKISRLPSMRLPTLEQLKIRPMSQTQRYWTGMGLSTSLLIEQVHDFEKVEEFHEYYQLLRQEAQAGEANAWNELGWLWMNGFFLACNHEQAIRALRIAAQLGCPEAYLNLGLLYGYAADKHLNQPEAVVHLKQAYERGVLLAAYSLGELYDGAWKPEEGVSGILIEADPDKAWEWFLRAAREGHVWASLKVALPQLEGTGLSGSVADGLAYLKKAAEYALSAEPAEALMELYLVTLPGSDDYYYWRDKAIAMDSRQAKKYQAYDAWRQDSEKEKWR